MRRKELEKCCEKCRWFSYSWCFKYNCSTKRNNICDEFAFDTEEEQKPPNLKTLNACMNCKYYNGWNCQLDNKPTDVIEVCKNYEKRT